MTLLECVDRSWVRLEHGKTHRGFDAVTPAAPGGDGRWLELVEEAVGTRGKRRAAAPFGAGFAAYAIRGHSAARAPVTVPAVRVATWNVNSVRQRVPRLLPWLDE